jgi:hypothetical protein
MRHLRRPDVRLVFAVVACVLLLLNAPVAVAFALWLAFGPPPHPPVIVAVPAGPQRRRTRATRSTIVDLVA